MKVSKKMIFGQKTHFLPWWLWPIVANNDPPSGQMIIYRKTECIQSYLRIWGRYDPIESGPSDTKKWGLYKRSVEKSRFLGQKWAPAAAPGPVVQRGQHKSVVILVSSHHWHWRTQTLIWKYNKYRCWFNSTAWWPKLAHCGGGGSEKTPCICVLSIFVCVFPSCVSAYFIFVCVGVFHICMVTFSIFVYFICVWLCILYFCGCVFHICVVVNFLFVWLYISHLCGCAFHICFVVHFIFVWLCI